MDFYKIIVERTTDPRAKQDYIVYPDFTYKRTTDLIVKGGEFFAFWNGEAWSRDQDDLIEHIDNDTWTKVDELKKKYPDDKIVGRSMNMESSGLMSRFTNYCKKQKSSNVLFNTKVLYADHILQKKDYATYQLSYTPTSGETPAFNEMMETLFEPEELNKILWAIGALYTGSISKIEKFLYLYGAKGTGKGTIINIIKDMFEKYWSPIDLQTLTGSSEFATSVVDEVPLLIDADTDISKIKKEVNLLKLTSHEELLKRVLYQTPYPVTFKGLLIAASNDRYTIKNKDSGLVRRPIVVNPTGKKIPFRKYHQLIKQVTFEIPFIAKKCIDTFEELGSAYFEDTVDVEMIAYSDKVFDFVRQNYYELSREDGVTLKRASELYANYLREMGWDDKGAKRELRTELAKYFEEYFKDTRNDDGDRFYNLYKGFRYDVAFPEESKKKKSELPLLTINSTKTGDFDILGKDWPAQYAKKDGTPENYWDDVTTTLKDLDSKKLHFVRVPQNYIVIDFDLKDPKTGEKSLALNLEKAAAYPKTYAELSKSEGGVHLHYIYDGDVSKLAPQIEDNIEIKVYSGKGSLRRKFTKCNGEPLLTISSGLPFKKESKKVFSDIEAISWTEKKLATFIESCINKEHHGATRPEMDFINKVLTDAKKSGVQYDLTSYFQKVLIFAMQSSHQKDYCVKLVGKIPFSSVDSYDNIPQGNAHVIKDKDLFFYDIEVFSNLLIICFKQYGKKLTRWINPTPEQIESLLKNPLIGFNNRKYDNHIIYNRYLGADNMTLYKQSQGIVNNVAAAMMAAAYNLSYADIYEFLDIKQSLKKFEIELISDGTLESFRGKLGEDIDQLTHDELEFAWDKPLAESDWERAAEYCGHDVLWTEILFRSKVGQDAYTARKIMSAVTDLPINTKTQTLAEKFIFGNDSHPQDQFVWYDLATEFPGYTFDKFRKPQSLYHGIEPSEGGYVFSKPGVYRDVWLDDVESLHPHSLIAINYFGKYTPKFSALVDCRMNIKHQDFEVAMHAFDSIDMELSNKLRPYLEDASQAGGLGHAMKIIINIVYGMTSAPYANKFKDPRNNDNIVAKRGALFMIMLHEELVEKFSAEVIHIKTDSFKIANGTEEMHEYMQKRANEFGYTFDHESTFSRLALINKAVLVGQISYPEKEAGQWEAIGAQYAFPYTFKSLFTGDDIDEHDFAILKSVKSSIYLGDRFVGKNAQIYASKTGEEIFRTGEADLSKRVQTRVMAIQKKSGNALVSLKALAQENIEGIAKTLNVEVDQVQYIINNNFAPEMITTYNALTGTKGYKWQLWQDYKGLDDIDMGYYKQVALDGVHDIYSVGDGDIMFKGTKWETYEKEIA